MAYKSIIANLHMDGPVIPLIEYATDFANQFNAHLIGFSAADINIPVASPYGIGMDGGLMQMEQEDIASHLKKLRHEFQRLAKGNLSSEWREAISNPTMVLLEISRAADVIIASHNDLHTTNFSNRRANLGELLVRSGRPVLLSPSGAKCISTDAALIAWKDTKQARRAISGAIPLLLRYDEVCIATVDANANSTTRESIEDLAVFLVRHGINARTEIIVDARESESLINFANTIGAQLIVSGAYGHSRLEEWVFGGITNSLLNEGKFSRFMAS